MSPVLALKVRARLYLLQQAVPAERRMTPRPQWIARSVTAARRKGWCGRRGDGRRFQDPGAIAQDRDRRAIACRVNTDVQLEHEPSLVQHQRPTGSTGWTGRLTRVHILLMLFILSVSNKAR